MPRIRVHRFTGDGVNDQDLEDLLLAAGCEEVESRGSEEFLLVILTPALSDDDGLEADLLSAVGANCPVVCIWPKGSAAGVVPEAVNKYSTDQIIWAPERLRSVVSGDEQRYYDEHDGTARRAPETPRHECE